MGLKIYRQSTAPIGEDYQLVQPGPDCILEFDNSDDISQEVELRLRDVNQTDPAGRAAIRISGTTLSIDVPTLSQWRARKTILECDLTNQGVSKLVYTEAGLAHLLETLLLHLEAGGLTQIYLRDLIARAGTN